MFSAVQQKLFQTTTPTTLTLVLILLFILVLIAFQTHHNCKTGVVLKGALLEPPMPMRLPVIGHLHLLGGYKVPYEAFTSLARKYGNVVKLQLGNVKCVVINEQKNIREALVTKGHHFDSRPNFRRYQELFCGNKENSLAFCNWSHTQKARRDMLKAYTFPRAFTNKFISLENLISSQTNDILSNLNTPEDIDLKPIILSHCANIFTNHFCSKNFQSTSKTFTEMVDNFDEIFYEVNQGYAADFLPFLIPLHKKNLKRVNGLTHKIRDFILTEVIEDRYEKYNVQSDPTDYVDSLIRHVKSGETAEFSWDTALFALEDIIGGHSAVGNFLLKLFAFLVREPEVQRRIQAEIDEIVGDERDLTIADRPNMPYTEAAIFEAIRLIASPIVPRVANQDSSINGYKIEKDTVLFLNNHELSMSESLWERPEKFEPERFIKDNRLVKPEHFLPFGGGRRSCMGYKMVQLVSFGILGGLLQKYTILPAQLESYNVPVGSLALPKNTFKFRFAARR